MFAYGNIIRYDPTLVDLKSNFFVPCTNMNIYLYNYSWWVEPSINIHNRKGKLTHISLASFFVTSTNSAKSDQTTHTAVANQALHSSQIEVSFKI